MVQLPFYEATRILFRRKENKKNYFIQQFVSSASPYSAILESITYVNNVLFCVSSTIRGYAVYVVYTLIWTLTSYPHTYVEYVVYVCDTVQNGTIGWHGGDKLLNKVIILVFFAHKKYSHSFVKLRLNLKSHGLFYFFPTFLSLDRIRILAIYESGGQRTLRMHQKYLHLCSEMNKGVWNDMKVSN